MTETIRKRAFRGSVVTVAYFVSSAAAGALLADSHMAGVSSFADISLAGALPAQYTAAVLIGGILRSVAAGTVGKNIVKLTAITIIFIAELFTERTAKPVFGGAVTAGAVILSGMAVSALTGELPYKLFFYVFYGALAGYTAYCASKVINELRCSRIVDLTHKRGRDHAVLYIVAVSALCALKLPAVNAGVITGCGVSLLAAHFYHQTGGVICGALSTCGVFLASCETGMNIALLPAAAMLTGCISERTPFVSALVFSALELLLMVLTGISSDSLVYMLDVFCGAALFLIAAPYYSDRYIVVGGKEENSSGRLENIRNVFLADTIDTVRAEFGKAAELIDRRRRGRGSCINDLKKICSGCCREQICWEMARQMTMRGFRKLEKLPEITQEKFPYELSECLRREELMLSVNRALRERLAEKLLRMRCKDVRSILSEQMNITGEILRNSCNTPGIRFSETMSCQIQNKLERHSIVPNKVISGYGSGGRLSAEIYFSVDESYDGTRIKDLIADELGIELIDCAELSSGRERRIRIQELPAYAVECCIASSCSSETGDNGDTAVFFEDGTGISYAVLSDGMGNGTDAALESRMAVKLFRRLVCSGADMPAAIKLVNSLMLAKFSEESFATFDTVRIDCDSGMMTISKSGAAATLLCRDDSVMKITAPTFPIGIYTHSEAYTAGYKLSEGDTVIMFSDGIGENAYPFIKELLLSGIDIRRITDEICAKAALFNPTLHNDDVTVVGLRIKSR